MRKAILTAAVLLLAATGAASAGPADVIKVKYKQDRSDLTWTFTVTVSYEDEGEEHYADKLEIIDQNGTILTARELADTQPDEQSFTLKLEGVSISETTQKVTIRAHDTVHNYDGKSKTVNLDSKRKRQRTRSFERSRPSGGGYGS